MASSLLEVYERTTRWYTSTINNRQGSGLDQANIESLFVTIYEEINKTVLRARIDVANGGNWDRGTTVSNGTMEIRLDPSDNAMAGDRATEVHVILLEGKTSGVPSEEFVHIFRYSVKNLPLIPTP